VTPRFGPVNFATLMNREVLDSWCERGILALVLAIMVFGPLATGAVRTPDFLVVQGLTLGVLVLWATRIWLSRKAQLLWPPICWAVLAFTLYAIGRYLKADIEYVARQEMISILVYAFLFYAIINNLHRQESIQIIIFSMIFLAMAISFYAIYQFLTDSTRVWSFTTPYKHRGSGTYICPNHLAGFLEMLLPLGLGYTLTSRLRPLSKVLLGYASLVMVAGIAVSVSRASWVATALALGFFFGVLLNHRSHRLPALVLLVLLVVGAVIVIPRSEHFQVRFKQLVHRGKVDDDLRLSLWTPAVKLWQENIWWGLGPAHFDYRFAEYRPEEVQLRPDRVHNDMLNTLVDYGVVGTILVACAWVLLGIGAAKTWGFVRSSASDLGGKKNSTKFAFVLGASAGLLALFLHSTIDFNFHIPANAILAIALMALLSAHLRFATERYWVGMRAGLKILVTFTLVIGFGYLAQQEVRRYREYVWLAKAEQLERKSLFSAKEAELLEKAFAVEPKNFDTAFRIGEAYRMRSQEGGADYQALATKAMEWYDRSIKLNPYKGYSYLNYGTCLDWLGKSAESAKYFSRAEELDPNGYYTVANVGLHYVQLGDYAAARPWFERSLRLLSESNLIASSYLQIVNEKMLEGATNEFRARLNSLTPP
jgi:O-antigen ligase/Tfp pilus assembly protein PilF